MVAQPVAWYDKPGSPAFPEAPSSVSHRAMAAMNGEGGAAAPTKARPGKGSGKVPTSRLEQYTAPGTDGRADKSSSSPGLFSSILEARLQTTMTPRTTDAAPSAAMETAIYTPPTIPGAATPPMVLDAPSTGCSTEDLRLWMMQVVQQQTNDVTDLQVAIANHVNGIRRDLDVLAQENQMAKKDVGVIEAVRHLVTADELETRTQSITADLKSLHAQANGFAEHLN